MELSENNDGMDIVEKMRNDGLPVIIFGAGIVGEVLFHACVEKGIRVDCFCENNIHKTKSRLCNTEIIHASTLTGKYKDAHVFISAADIKDVVEQLERLGFRKWHSASELLRNYNVFKNSFSASGEFVEFAVTTCLLCHDSFLMPEKLFLRSVDIVITERCSLKCRDCSNLMQYYENPRDFTLDEIIRSIDVFCSIVDEVNEFRVIGGEPFMNKEIHLVVKKLIDEPKVRRIVIYTNGTMVPRENQIEYFKNNKILFIITDYGSLSKKLSDLTQLLVQHDIAHHIMSVSGWADCSSIQKHGRTIQQQQEIFRDCCAKNLTTLIGGKLFRCPFAGNAARLNAVPEFIGDYIDIFQVLAGDLNILSAKKKIKEFLMTKKFLETCDYCNGRPLGAPEKTPAIQIKEPLRYKRAV